MQVSEIGRGLGWNPACEEARGARRSSSVAFQPPAAATGCPHIDTVIHKVVIPDARTGAILKAELLGPCHADEEAHGRKSSIRRAEGAGSEPAMELAPFER